jgi:hypothetical protein
MEPPTSFLPKGEFTQKLNLGIRANVAVLKKDADHFEGVSFVGNLSGGKLKGSVSIKSIFGGTVDVAEHQLML